MVILDEGLTPGPLELSMHERCQVQLAHCFLPNIIRGQAGNGDHAKGKPDHLAEALSISDPWTLRHEECQYP